MTFQLETQMLAPAKRWLEGRGLRTKHEFPTPWGICDLVGLSFKESNVRRRLRYGQTKPLGPAHRIALLMQIPPRSAGSYITLQRLQREFWDLLSPVMVATELERLLAWNFICSPRKNAFQKVDGWRPLHDRIVAVELKLSRIEEVLSQARSHVTFADESFVGLPQAVAERLVLGKRVEDFRSAGVGVLSVHHKRCEVLLPSKPRRREINPVLQQHCVERFWRTRLTGSSA